MFDGDDIARMIFGGLGRGGFGGRGWGRRRGWGRMGGMGGWVIPAMIIGRIIEEATRQHDAGQSPPPSPAPPQPRNSQPATGAPPTPWADTPPVQAAAPEPKPRIECRYCGREVPAGAHACLGCGAPQHP